jgi:hypothetical protein
MNETVDSVYRFVTDQSSSAYNKMNSFVASLRRRFDKVLTAAASSSSNSTSTNPTSLTTTTNDGEIFLLKGVITDAHLMLALTNNDNDQLKTCLHAAENLQQQQSYSPTTARRLINEIRSYISLSNSDEYYLSNIKSDQSKKPDKNLNVYDTLSKHRPLVRSNPNLNNTINKNEAGKPVNMPRYSLRSSMRNLIKRRTIKVPSKKILGSSNDSQTPHIYESLDSPSLDIPSSNNSASVPEQSSYISTPILKSSYIIPSSIVVLDHFTTNLYLVVNSTLNQLLVVFGSTKIHTIKLYDTNGRKLHTNDLILQYNFEDLHGYKLLSSALNNNSQNRLIINEIRVYVTESLDDTTTNQTLKQRLLFFDQNGHFISASKRLPITNELLFVEVDRLTPSIYAYDGLNLINLERNWSTNIENIDCISSGSTFLACLHTKTNQISIFNNQTGSFIYRWLITTPNIHHLQTIYLCVSRQDLIYVLVWNCDVHPMNNLVLVFDQDGQLHREYYMPNRIVPNIHGTYTYDMTIGGHQTTSPFGNLIRRSSRKPDQQTMPWIQQQTMWNASGRHPQLWTNNPGIRSQMSQIYQGLGRPYEMYHHHHHQQQQQEDNTIFYARFIAITDDDTLILSNIIDLGLDEETQETAVVNVSRKILFFHLDT